MAGGKESDQTIAMQILSSPSALFPTSIQSAEDLSRMTFMFMNPVKCLRQRTIGVWPEKTERTRLGPDPISRTNTPAYPQRDRGVVVGNCLRNKRDC